ncbi:hypothetical protein RI054_05g29610 [Pseudoscourfieldia marina]
MVAPCRVQGGPPPAERPRTITGGPGSQTARRGQLRGLGGDRLNDEPTRAFVPGREFSIEDAEEVYSRLGFPGAMGCMDVIHVASRAFTKEGFPTIALNVVSGPRRSCTFIGDAQPGARNDKAICKICPSVASLRQDKTLQWQLETPGGVLQMTGAYVLVDGGYVKYAQLMAPYKTTTDAAKALWSKRLESVRKEVEALFGEWRARGPNTPTVTSRLSTSTGWRRTRWPDEERIRAQSGNGSADADGDADGEQDAVYDDTFDSMRLALVKHFSILKARGELGWLTPAAASPAVPPVAPGATAANRPAAASPAVPPVAPGATAANRPAAASPPVSAWVSGTTSCAAFAATGATVGSDEEATSSPIRHLAIVTRTEERLRVWHVTWCGPCEPRRLAIGRLSKAPGVLRELLWRRSSRGCWVAPAHTQVKWPQREQSRDVFRNLKSTGHLC